MVALSLDSSPEHVDTSPAVQALHLRCWRVLPGRCGRRFSPHHNSGLSVSFLVEARALTDPCLELSDPDMSSDCTHLFARAHNAKVREVTIHLASAFPLLERLVLLDGHELIVKLHHTLHQAFDPNTRFLVCVTVMFPNPADGSCAERDHGSSGSAKRRRQRRLRSWLRHERQSVAMELAAALHHSRDARSEVVHEAPRGQKTASSGKRPAALRESGPQLVAVHAGCPCSCLPSLATPSLADATADVVDSSSLRFLAASALEARRKEEQEERARRIEEKAQLLAVPRALRTPEQKRRIDEICAESLASRYSQLARRKRKKRRKKKLPRCTLPRQGCRRLCDHQRQAPTVSQTLGIPVMIQRQVPTVYSFMLPVQFLVMVFDMPVVVLRQVLGLMVQNTVVRPQLQSIEGRRLSLSFSRDSSSWSRLFTRPQRFFQLLFDFRLSMSLLFRVVQVLRCCRGEDLGAPTVAAR